MIAARLAAPLRRASCDQYNSSSILHSRWDCPRLPCLIAKSTFSMPKFIAVRRIGSRCEPSGSTDRSYRHFPPNLPRSPCPRSATRPESSILCLPTPSASSSSDSSRSRSARAKIVEHQATYPRARRSAASSLDRSFPIALLPPGTALRDLRSWLECRPRLGHAFGGPRPRCLVHDRYSFAVVRAICVEPLLPLRVRALGAPVPS
jgi:hypothetical protein